MKKGKRKNNSRDEKELLGVTRDTSFLRATGIYLVFCLTVIAALVISINKLVTENDKKLTTDICSLVTEKMNNSINYMTSSALNTAVTLSEERHRSLYDLHNTLSPLNYTDKDSGTFLSIGFIDCDQNIYANETELGEFEKWQLLDTAALADPVSVSAPYRSGITGQPVFTIFAKMSYGGGRTGQLFLTYPLTEIQKMASSQSLIDNTEIWLMNAESDNVIRCAGTDEHAIGSWSNALVLMKEINSEDKDSYRVWTEMLKKDTETAVLSSKIGRTAYTQVGSRINFMNGWYVVVRIPSSSLSDTLHTFRMLAVIFLVLLFSASLMIFLIAHKRSAQEKQILRNLSIHDSLTGVMNRRAFDFTAEQRLQKAQNRSGMTLLFFDVDYFKHVNDVYGHEAGDKILREFSAALKDLFGQDGFVSRYGGDEFVVLTDITDRGILTSKLDELKVRTAQIKPGEPTGEAPGEGFRLSYSAGAAVFPKDGNDLKDLEASADAALYEVKKNGRNGYGWYSRA